MIQQREHYNKQKRLPRLPLPKSGCHSKFTQRSECAMLREKLHQTHELHLTLYKPQQYKVLGRGKTVRKSLKHLWLMFHLFIHSIFI